MATMESQRETSEPPGIWQLAFPSILGNLLFSVVGLVQTKVVGELGAQALAAVGAGQRIFFALMAVMMAISAGTVALVARAWGAGDTEEAGRVTLASLVIACGFGLVLTAVGVLFAEPVASIFGLDDDTVEMAARNIRWLSLFNVAFAVIFILPSALRAAGDAWTPLYFGAGVNLINIPLLYMFVFGLYGAPAMGVAGAAVAAGIAFTVGAIVMMALWFGQRLRIGYYPHGWLKKARLKRLLDIGYPAGIEQVVFQAGFFAFLMIIGRFYGTEAFAAYNIGVNLLSVCMVVGFGFSIAGSTLVGQHLGADDPVGAARAGWRSGGMSALSMGVLGIIVIIFASELAEFILGDEPLTIQYTVEFTWILGAAMPLLGIEFAIGGALRGAGDTRFPLMATFFGLIGMRCGLAALATLFGLPVFWVYASLAGDYLLKGAMLTWRFHSGRWKSVVRNEDLYFT
jgi:putative MATE family efflux protein